VTILRDLGIMTTGMALRPGRDRAVIGTPPGAPPAETVPTASGLTARYWQARVPCAADPGGMTRQAPAAAPAVVAWIGQAPEGTTRAGTT